jgi:ABC-type sugar transport system permease subunit
MLANPVFREVLGNTFVYGFLQVFLTTLIGLGCALLADSGLNRFGSVFKVAVFYPYILPWTVAAMVWMYIFHPTRGIVNALLGMRIQWLNDFKLTLYVLVFISVWKTAGFNFLLFLSGLQSIPKDLYEAVRLETDSRSAAFWRITLPNCRSGVLAGTILAFARALGEYGATSMLAGYTPGRTATISTTVYQLWRTGDDLLAYKWVAVNIAISVVVLMFLNLAEGRKRRA